MNKKYSTKFKLLTVGAILFAFGVVTSAVATSAWYNLLDIAVVSNLNLKIDVSDAKLDLGLKQKSSGEVIWLDENHPDGFSKEELEITDTVLTDVSGMYESDWLNESTNYETAIPKFHTRYKPGLGIRNTGFISDEEVKKNIVQEEFIFYSEKYDMEIFLADTTSFTANTLMNRDAAKEKAEKYGLDSHDENVINQLKDKLDKVIYATRMSFYSEEDNDYRYLIVNPHKGEDVIDNEVETYYGGVLDLNKDGFIDFNSETLKENLYGELIDNSKPVPYSGIGMSTDDYKKDVLKYNTFEGEHKLGVQIVDWQSAKDNVKVENSNNLKHFIFDENDPLNRTPICYLKKGEQKRVIMSIYVEGWDRHMTDDIESASFDVSIAFTGLIK